MRKLYAGNRALLFNKAKSPAQGLDMGITP